MFNRILWPTFAGLVLTACATPTYLVGQRFSSGQGSRYARYTISPTAATSNSDGRLYDLSVRLCDQQEDGASSHCKDSLVLQNVVPRTVY